MSRFLQHVEQRLPDYPPYYEARAGDLLRLDQNTNRWGPPRHVAKAELNLTEGHLYPHRDNAPLATAFAEAHGIDPASVFVGNGSDQVLDDLIRILVPPGGRVVTPAPSYSLFPHLCRLSRVDHVGIPYDESFALDPTAVLAAEPDLVILANPDNPSGTVQEPAVIDAVLDGFDGPVVLDEAYGDYAKASRLADVGRRPNLIVTRTLSKAYGMAGLRVGFGAAHPTVAELVRRARIPFSVNQASQAMALQALADPEAITRTARQVAAGRDRLKRELERRGLAVVPSQANFVLVRPPVPPADVRAGLEARGILVRTLDHDQALAPYFRVTVGPDHEIDAFLSALDQVLAEARP